MLAVTICSYALKSREEEFENDTHQERIEKSEIDEWGNNISISGSSILDKLEGGIQLPKTAAHSYRETPMVRCVSGASKMDNCWESTKVTPVMSKLLHMAPTARK